MCFALSVVSPIKCFHVMLYAVDYMLITLILIKREFILQMNQLWNYYVWPVKQYIMAEVPTSPLNISPVVYISHLNPNEPLHLIRVQPNMPRCAIHLSQSINWVVESQTLPSTIALKHQCLILMGDNMDSSKAQYFHPKPKLIQNRTIWTELWILDPRGIECYICSEQHRAET